MHGLTLRQGMLTHMCNSISNGSFWTPENVTKIGFGFGVTWLVGFTQIIHEDAGPASRGQNESPFSTSPGAVTKTGKTNTEQIQSFRRYSPSFLKLNGFELIRASDF